METSRVFVRGLPPSITDAELRKHFSTGNREVTDVKAIPQRRIGYVGFKTPEDAKKAVKYFNKSYVRMSRLYVELAKPIGDPTLQKTKAKGDGPIAMNTQVRKPTDQAVSAEDDTAAGTRKRKRDENVESDPKLREYLQVFHPSQNPVDDKGEVVDSAAIAEREKMLKDGESDDEYETIPSRPEKRQIREAPNGMPTSNPVEEPSKASNQEDDAGDTQPPPTESPLVSMTDAPTTDDDWMRSRTNRLLDLVGDDEDIPLPPPQPTTRPEAGDQGTAADPAAPLKSDVQLEESPSAAEEAPNATGQGEEDAALTTIQRTARLFIRNLPYTATESDLREHFEQYGEMQEVHLPVTKSGSSKGYALILFTNAESAVAAFQSSDGQTFQGRLLHVLPAAGRRDASLDEFEMSKLPLKKQNLIRKKAEAASSTFNWNSLYMSQDAVNASVANRLGVSKSELLDPTDASAAVKQAVAESTIINETKRYFAANGLDLNAFKSQKRGDTCILVKNFPHGTSLEEIRKLFEEHGTVLQVLMPPSGTIAIVQFALPAQGRAAFGKLAYRRIKDSVLFLEKGPKDLFGNDDAPQMTQTKIDQQPSGIQKLSVTELLERNGGEEEGEAQNHSLFVGNLNFATRTNDLTDKFGALEGFVSARVKTKTDPKKPGQVLSMGFGFLEFRTKEQAHAAAKTMNGFVLDGHTLNVKASHRGQDAAEERRRDDAAKKKAGQRTKIIIKNLPFEATKKDIRTLFGTYGQLRAVRVPKKFGQSSRGFAFAEFVTPREAENARAALENTHLLGRRLVLDFAEAETVDAEEEIEKMQKKIGGQVDKVALAQLTGRTRKKVNIGENNDEFDAV